VGKYEELTTFLRSLERRKVVLSFDRVEEIISAKLPATARTSRAFWANDVTHATSNAWMSCGYETRDVDLEAGELLFQPFSEGRSSPEELEALALGALLLGPRSHLVNDLRRDLRGRSGQRTREHDVATYRSICTALESLGLEYFAKVCEEPSRGRPRPPGYAQVTVKNNAGTAMLLTISEGTVKISTAVDLDVTRPAHSRRTAERVLDTELFLAMWNSDRPYLAAAAQTPDRQVVCVTLSGVVWLPNPHDVTSCRRLIRWCLLETETFGDGLRKILTRETRVDAARALELARNRLNRYVRPSADRIVLVSRPEPPAPFALFSLLAEWANDER